MLTYSAILLLAASLFATPTPINSAKQIVGGVPVEPKFKYSWLVSLQTKSNSFHFCGGIRSVSFSLNDRNASQPNDGHYRCPLLSRSIRITAKGIVKHYFLIVRLSRIVMILDSPFLLRMLLSST